MPSRTRLSGVQAEPVLLFLCYAKFRFFPMGGGLEVMYEQFPAKQYA